MTGVIKRLSVNLHKSYDKPHNQFFKNKIENIQHKACTVITGAIQGTSQEHLYHELGLESLGD